MRVGQQALGHGHGQIRNAGLLNQSAYVGVCLSVGCTLAQNDERPFSAFEQVQSALDCVCRGNLARRRVNDFDQRALALQSVHGL